MRIVYPALVFMSLVSLSIAVQESSAFSHHAPVPVPTPVYSPRIGDHVCLTTCPNDCMSVVKQLDPDGGVWVEPACMGPQGIMTAETVYPAPGPSIRPDIYRPFPAIDPSGPQVEMISVGEIKGATMMEKLMIAEGVKLANKRVQSNCFRQWVLAAHYTENNNLSQAAILDLSVKTPSKVNVEFFTGSFKQNFVWKTVGYENDPYDGWVHMNRHFVKSAIDVGDNLIHEDRGHGLGFHHYGVKATSDPYGMNYAYEGCSNQQMQAKGGKLYKPPGLRLEIRRTHK